MPDVIAFSTHGGSLEYAELLAERIASGVIEVGLYNGSFFVGPDITFADLTEVGWSGYARAVATVAGLVKNPINSWQAVLDTITFVNESGGSGTYYGWFVIDTSASDRLLCASRPGSPLSLAAGGSLPVSIAIGTSPLY